MRPGPPRGETVTADIVVTPDTAEHAGPDGQGPLIYTTSALATDAERLCRSLVEPHLEAGEYAVAAAIELRHRAPIPVGETVRLHATVATVVRTKLVCELLIRHGSAIVARGSFEHRIVDADTFDDEVAAHRSTTG